MKYRSPAKYALVCAILILFAFGFNGVCAGPTAQMEKNIRQGTNLNLDDYTKSLDKTIETVINGPLQTMPSLGGGFYKMEATCSHGVVTLEGKVRYNIIKKRAEDLAKSTDRVKKVINNIVVDPNLEPDVADLIGEDWFQDDEASEPQQKKNNNRPKPRQTQPGGGGGSLDDILKGLGD